MRLYVAKKMPDPRDSQYEDALEKWIAYFLSKTNGRAFVLFTSYKTMMSLAQRMEPELRSQLYFHGPRTRLIAQSDAGPV